MTAMERSSTYLKPSIMSEAFVKSAPSRQSEWSTLSPHVVLRITNHISWTDFGTLRSLNKHWCKSVDHSIRTAKISSMSSIPTDLLLKFRRLEYLTIDYLNEISLAAIKVLDKLTSLKSLTIRGMRLGMESLHGIASCSHLKELSLYDINIPRNSMDALDSLSQLTQLSSLRMVYVDVERVEFGGNHCVDVVSKLDNLKELELRFDMTSEVLEKLTTLTSLENLCISSITLYIPNLYFLKPLNHLRQLRLPWTHFSTYEVEELENLSNISLLDLGATDVTDDSIKDFSRLTNLRHLVLKDNCITDGVLDHISTLTDLQSLDVSHGAGLSDVCGLRNLSSLCGLKSLNLNGTHIEDSDIISLSHLTNLERLDIGLTDVTDAGIDHLSSITSLNEINTEVVRNLFD